MGTMNLIVVWINKEGKKEVITCPNNGLILPSITKDSVLQILRQQKEYLITEREYTMTELLEAVKEKRLLEMFGTGTAVVVCPVKGLYYDGQTYEVPTDRTLGAGKLTCEVYKKLKDIQMRRIESRFCVIVPQGFQVK